MSVAYLVDHVRVAAQQRGIAMRMQRGRDLVCRLLFGKPYSAAIAAERDGKLGLPELDDSRTRELRAHFGSQIDQLADIAAEVIAFPTFVPKEESTMSATDAITAAAIPAPPALTPELIDAWRAQAAQRDEAIQAIPLSAKNTHAGKHLRFVQTGDIWHALENEYLVDGSAYMTAQLEGAVFQFVGDEDEEEDAHFFLTNVYRNGRWTLERSEHLLAEGRHLDLNYAQLADAD